MSLLSNYRPYLSQIERLHKKYLAVGKLGIMNQGGVTFSRISIFRKSFAKTLAKEVASGRYQFKPVEKRKIPKAGKPGKFRTIYLLEISDLVVHGVLAELVTNWVEAVLPSSTYSYRTTKTWWHGVTDFAGYVRKHVAERKNPKERGLYVLRADVKQYFETIPVGTNSKLWTILQNLVDKSCEDAESARAIAALLPFALRPVVREQNCGPYSEISGIPTGSPLCPSVSNLYLNSIDRTYSEIPGGFYARYGDDILFAHPEETVVTAAGAEMQKRVSELDLRLNDSKTERIYFNGAGAPPPGESGFTGRSMITFLGCDITFKGEITIKKKGTRGFVQTIRRRVRKIERLVRDSEPDIRGQTICQMVNRILDPNSAFKHPYIAFLLGGVTSRDDLKYLDFTIALVIAEALSGIKGVKAFRKVPYKTIRSRWKLISLVTARNAR